MRNSFAKLRRLALLLLLLPAGAQLLGPVQLDRPVAGHHAAGADRQRRVHPACAVYARRCLDIWLHLGLPADGLGAAAEPLPGREPGHRVSAACRPACKIARKTACIMQGVMLSGTASALAAAVDLAVQCVPRSILSWDFDLVLVASSHFIVL